MIRLQRDVVFGAGVIVRDLTNLYDCHIGDDTRIGAYTEIGGAIVGARCKIGAHVFIPPGVTIGDEVFIGPGTIFTNDKHPRATGPWTCEHTVVESGASIGAGCVILPGVRIGAGATIGAGCRVIDDVPAGVTIVTATQTRAL